MSKSLQELRKKLHATKLYFFSPTPFTRFNNKIQHSKLIKPNGLWFACGNDWIKFMLDNDFKTDAYDYLYELKIDATKILVIKTFNALEKFNKEYSYTISTTFDALDFLTGKQRQVTEEHTYINWASVSKVYDGIMICPSFMNKIWKLWKKQPSIINNFFWYYMWDIASGVIWNEKAFDSANLLYKRNATTNRWEVQTKKSILMQVIGLGCSSVDQHVIASYEQYLANKVGMSCIVYCNQSLTKTLYDVAKTCTHFIPSKKHKFVVKIFNNVKKYLEEGYDVYLLGHSYGGSVVSRIAELMRNSTHTNLHIITFGSIYVPKPERITGVDLKHYMFVNDVALKCNKLGKNDKREEHVIWLQSPTKTSTKMKKSIFGTEEEWKAHNAYNFEKEVIYNMQLPVKALDT